MESTQKSSIKLVLGAANIGDAEIDPMVRFDTPDQVNAFLNAFSNRGYNQLDTSRMYSPHAPGTSEPRIGAVAAGDRFVIDTKVTSIEPGAHTKDKILEEIDISLEALKIDQINVEYLHVPDRDTPFEEACEAMTQAHREGKIKHWGICSYTAEEVQRFIDICEERGFVKPTVYQGQYNPIVRGGEKDLFNVLRKNGMAFYAFSPAAGGFFAGNHKNFTRGGRFDKSIMVGELYTNFYMKPSIMAAADKALKIASEHGISGHAAALRWTAYHGILSRIYDDSIIIGASSPEQLESNIDTVEQGPLPEDVAAAFEAVYGEIDSDVEIPYHL
ncbi:putative aldo/keto reductase [Colletotrichum karsti]|uniref:Aldo/keto reductase n=1 Tax=Colletotrichum karsti TaxID=1095194 RepID=A0A9P6HUR6_9PEZI|nr:putative aldo/keto reductase [Colletotrichum karsti]KAF9870699.1 putative aldo/keto reductase [Colletotrichum karsti]